MNETTSDFESDGTKYEKNSARSLLNTAPRKKKKPGRNGNKGDGLSASVCLFCGVTTHLKNHLWLKHEILKETQTESNSSTKEVYTCKRCGISFPPEDAVNHWKQTHKECPVSTCSCSFKTDEEVKQHQENEHNWSLPKPNGMKCKICPMRFFTQNLMLKHMKIDHRSEMPQLPCSHCDLIFRDPLHLKRHQLAAHHFGSSDQGNHQCGFCLNYFSDISNYRHHVKELHYKGFKPSEDKEPDNIKCFLCVNCPYCSTKEELKAHEDSEEHKSEINLRISVFCNLCKKNFEGNLEALKDHFESQDHQNELASLGDFDRETFCIPCRQSFGSFEELYTHEKKSIEHKNICKEFRQNQLEENVVQESPLICHACPNVFDSRVELERHIKKFHPLNGHFCKVSLLKIIIFDNILTRFYTYLNDDLLQDCGKTLNDWNEFLLHRRNHNKLDAKDFTCDVSVTLYVYHIYSFSIPNVVLYSRNVGSNLLQNIN